MDDVNVKYGSGTSFGKELIVIVILNLNVKINSITFLPLWSGIFNLSKQGFY